MRLRLCVITRMRRYAKRLALIICGALATTVLVTVLNSFTGPNMDIDGVHVVNGPSGSSKEGAAMIVGGLKPLLKKQSPESALLMADRDSQKLAGDEIQKLGKDEGPKVEKSDLEKNEGPKVKKNDLENEGLKMEKSNLDSTGKKSQPIQSRLMGEKKEGKGNDVEMEEPWAKDDQVIVPTDLKASQRKTRDPIILALKDQLHLDEFRTRDECTNRTTLADYYWSRYRKSWPKDDNWDRFYAQIGSCDMYREHSEILDTLLNDLSTLPIRSVVNMEGGTQIKLILTFENGKRAVFKPMRFSRQYETDPNHFYFSDFERHHAEIAAFHLDKVLGYRRAVPTAGRVVNISDLWAKADKPLAKTFFYSPAKNLCFVGKCDYYCDTTHAICGSPDMKEGSTQMFLPDEEIVPREHNKSPYKRTYSKRNQEAEWQKDPTYCNWKVKYTPPFSSGRRLLDLVDLYILDFLMGNQDRHHYETMTVFEGYAPPFVHLDNGRAFGKPRFDDMSILAPLTQCCVIKPSTARTLLDYYLGPISLSQALRQSLSKDPVAPVLAEKYLRAVDRRLEIVLRELGNCVRRANGDYRKVLINTFHNPDAPTATEDEEDDDD